MPSDLWAPVYAWENLTSNRAFRKAVSDQFYDLNSSTALYRAGTGKSQCNECFSGRRFDCSFFKKPVAALFCEVIEGLGIPSRHLALDNSVVQRLIIDELPQIEGFSGSLVPTCVVDKLQMTFPSGMLGMLDVSVHVESPLKRQPARSPTVVGNACDEEFDEEFTYDPVFDSEENCGCIRSNEGGKMKYFPCQYLVCLSSAGIVKAQTELAFGMCNMLEYRKMCDLDVKLSFKGKSVPRCVFEKFEDHYHYCQKAYATGNLSLQGTELRSLTAVSVKREAEESVAPCSSKIQKAWI